MSIEGVSPSIEGISDEEDFALTEEQLIESERISEKYKKEILPLLEILKPEDVPMDQYEDDMISALFEDAKKIEMAKGTLINDQESTFNDIENLLKSRLQAAIEDEDRDRTYETGSSSDFVLKAKAALILSGEGYKEKNNYFRNEESQIGELTKKVFKNLIQKHEFDTVRDLLGNLDKSSQVMSKDSLYYTFTPKTGDASFSKDTHAEILSGKMPYWVFKRYKDMFERDEFTRECIPENHYNRAFLGRLLSDADGMHRLGLFKDYGINSGFEQKISDLAKDNRADADMLGGLDDNEIVEITKAMKALGKEHYRELRGSERKSNFLSVFNKSDFEDILSNGVSILEILPKDLPKNMSQEMEDFFVSRWKEEILTKGNLEFSSENNQSEMAEVFLHMSADDLKVIILNNIDLDFTLLPSSRLHEMFLDDDFQGRLFDKIKEKPGIEKNGFEKLQHIQESFMVLQGKEKLPDEILQILDRFEEKFGNKGKGLIGLAIAAYGTSNLETFSTHMKSIETILEKYDPTMIPEGTHVSMGIEYEATWGMEKFYEDSILGYKKDIELVSYAAGINKGRDAMHEIALKPTYNPYIMLAEVHLLKEIGFIDFNFEKYPQAPRGYHLSLVGENGLHANKDTRFLHNLMTMSELTGVLAGKEVKGARGIYTKDFEMIDGRKQKGERVEIKGMGCDTVEQFEKAVVTSHHAGIAIQVCDKYGLNSLTINDIPEDVEGLEYELSIDPNHSPFNNNVERDIAFAWLNLKKTVFEAVEQHNESFIDSEFVGYFLDNKGEYIDSTDHIDVSRNKKLLISSNGEPIDTNTLIQQLHIPPNDLFEDQKVSLINPLIRANNIFLKGPQGEENSSVNAKSMLDVVKEEGYGSFQEGRPTQSIFENGGELRQGYYVVQGASEEMISHKVQILLNRFNKEMELLLKGESRTLNTENNQLVAA
ncbi:MAG: hypothetical protein ABIO57_01595 [Candidatus Paceibacterota bacterium]